MGPGAFLVSTRMATETLTGEEGAGVVFGLQNGKDYGLAWIQRDRVRLLRCSQGGWTELASATLSPADESGQREWSLLWQPHRVLVASSGRSRLLWRGETTGQGRVGTATSAHAPPPRRVSARPALLPQLADNFQATQGRLAAWKPTAGDWRVDAVQDPWLKLDQHPPKSSRYRGSGGKPAITLTGDATWADYVADVAVQFVQPSTAGIVYAYRDAKNYGYLVIRPVGERGEALLGAIVDGADRIVARRAVPVRVGPWYRLRVENTAGRVRGYVGHVEVGHAGPVGPVLGKAGLVVTSGGDALFDDLTIEPATPEALLRPKLRRAVFLRAGFEKLAIPGELKNQVRKVLGDLMKPEGPAKWSITNRSGDAKLRLAAGGQGRSALWFHRPVRGDASVELEVLPVLPATPGTALLGLIIAADEAGVGYELSLQPERIQLLRAGKVLQEKRVPLAKEVTRIRLSREGRQVLAQVGGLTLQATDKQPLEGGRTGFWAAGPVEIDNLEIGNALGACNAFRNVETDWQPGAGKWVEHSGMACIAWRYWIGAHAEPEEALIWNALVWPEHTTASVWVSEATDGDENKHHRHHPYHDLQFVMSGNDSAPYLGYRFLIATGPYKDQTLLYRHGKVVAESREFKIAKGRHANTPRTVRITARRDGARIALWVGDSLLMEYEDPEPLGPGQIAIGCVGCRANFKDFTAFVDKPWLSKGLPAKW